MEIAVCAFLAYLLAGFSQVSRDLGGQAIDRPIWTFRPTGGMTIFVLLSWPLRPLASSGSVPGRMGRSIYICVVAFVTQMVVLTTFLWAAYAIAGTIAGNALVRMLVAGGIGMLGSLFVLPLVALIMMPVTLLLMWPVDILWPLRSAEESSLQWCRTCKHHRKVPAYEDTMHGLWRKEQMPDSSALPCAISAETQQVWSKYFAMEPKTRSLFPKDCPRFEKSM